MMDEGLGTGSVCAGSQTAESSIACSAMGLAVKLGGIHLLIDASCLAVLYSEVSLCRLEDETLVALVLLYNSLAFGLQWLVGIMADMWAAYRFIGVVGTLLVAAAAIVEPSFPWSGATLAGIGNAFFHVGAGAAVLLKSQGRASESGVFVAPGAAGVVIGLWLGLNSDYWRGPAVALLLCSSLLLLRVIPVSGMLRNFSDPIRSLGFFWPSRLSSSSPRPLLSKSEPCRPADARISQLLVPVVFLFSSVAIRSFAGGGLSGAWRLKAFAGFALAASAVAGKCLGGIIGDRFGWRASSALAMIISAPLVAAGLNRFDAAMTGMLFLQFTMPVTLAAIYCAFPRWPGLAFGLPCLGLLFGALPDQTGLMEVVPSRWLMAALAIVSALLLFVGLKSTGRSTNRTSPKEMPESVQDFLEAPSR